MSDNDWGGPFAYNRKRGGPRIEPSGAPDFNVPASEKNINTNQKLSV